MAMAQAGVPDWMYEERTSLRHRLEALECGLIRLGKRTGMFSEEDAIAAKMCARQRLAECESMLAKAESAARGF